MRDEGYCKGCHDSHHVTECPLAPSNPESPAAIYAEGERRIRGRRDQAGLLDVKRASGTYYPLDARRSSRRLADQHADLRRAIEAAGAAWRAEVAEKNVTIARLRAELERAAERLALLSGGE